MNTAPSSALAIAQGCKSSAVAEASSLHESARISSVVSSGLRVGYPRICHGDFDRPVDELRVDLEL